MADHLLGQTGKAAGTIADSSTVDVYTDEQDLDFFSSTWGMDGKKIYDFRAYFARRCFDLNELAYHEVYCRSIRDSDKLIQLSNVRQSFITQNALLGYVGKLADSYIGTGDFPKILLVDELMIYGRELSAFLHRLETAVLHTWEEKTGNALDDGKARKIRGDLMRAVDVQVYARNKKQLLLKEQFRSRINNNKIMTISQWRSYTQSVSGRISSSDVVENTSYEPFFRLSGKQYEKLSRSLQESLWQMRTWTYRRLRTDIWQKSAYTSNSGIQMQLTMRCHSDEESGAGTVRVIPRALFDGLSFSSMELLCEDVARYFENEDAERFQHFIDLLSNSGGQVKQVQIQLISFLISVIIFYEAVEKAGIRFSPKFVDTGDDYPLGKNHDLDKIAQNFGRQEDTYAAVMELCKTDARAKEHRKKIRNILWDILECKLPVLWRDHEYGKACNQSDRCLILAEDFFYAVGLKDEKRLSDLQKEGVVYGSDVRTDIYSHLTQYFEYFESKSELYSFEDCAGALLMLLDQGVAGMTSRVSHLSDGADGESSITNDLRAGEQSLYVGARRFYRYIPALIVIETRCRQLGYSVIKQATRFGQLLDREEPGQNMEDAFHKLVYLLYYHGQLLRDWEFDLLYMIDQPVRNGKDSIRSKREWCMRDWDDEWKIIEACTYEEYLSYEREKQEQYKQKAEQFRLS